MSHTCEQSYSRAWSSIKALTPVFLFAVSIHLRSRLCFRSLLFQQFASSLRTYLSEPSNIGYIAIVRLEPSQAKRSNFVVLYLNSAEIPGAIQGIGSFLSPGMSEVALRSAECRLICFVRNFWPLRFGLGHQGAGNSY